MSITPITNWISTYESKLNDYYDQYQLDPSYEIVKFWAGWVNSAGTGIQVAPPYASTGTTSEGSFSPVNFTPSMLAPQSALVLANAWQSWALGITWQVPAPVPPFSVIDTVVTSPLGVAAAYVLLLAGLTAEFLTPSPPDGDAAMLIKKTAIGTLFYTATLSMGVQISGLGIGGPPPPLVIPLWPTL